MIIHAPFHRRVWSWSGLAAPMPMTMWRGDPAGVHEARVGGLLLEEERHRLRGRVVVPLGIPRHEQERAGEPQVIVDGTAGHRDRLPRVRGNPMDVGGIEQLAGSPNLPPVAERPELELLRA